ncbi:MAG: precorrin-3B C(17)-methyltransferase [Desulfomonilaceae bacterium]
MRAPSRKEDTINSREDNISRRNHSNSAGKLFIVGIGPGGPLDRTRRAELALAQSQVIVGYSRYLALIKVVTQGKELISSGMTKETERCRIAIEKALGGSTVALVSSGDPGIYGMAGLALELLGKADAYAPIEIVPGVTSAAAAAARLGAPLMLDFACISLSDLLAPWETIRQRLEATAAADLVVALYNPKSRTRHRQLAEAAEIFRRYRPGDTPVGVCTAIGTEDETVALSDIDHFLELEINMRSIVIVGNSSSRRINNWFVTPRGYKI